MAETSAQKSYRQESLQEWIDKVKDFVWTYDLTEEHLRLGVTGFFRVVVSLLLESSRLPRKPVDEEYRTLYLVGTCPRCRHEMDKVVPRRRPDDDPPWKGEVLVYCNCATAHPDQPAGRTGCGSYGHLTVKPPPEPRTIVASTAKPDDLRLELRAEGLFANRLADARAAAQKWAAAVTSITGVFGIVALIKGPSSIEALHSPGREFVIALVGLAIFLALLGIGLAVAAAGGRARLGHLSGREARFWESWQAAAAINELKWSHRFAYVAVLAMLAAIIVTWTGT